MKCTTWSSCISRCTLATSVERPYTLEVDFVEMPLSAACSTDDRLWALVANPNSTGSRPAGNGSSRTICSRGSAVSSSMSTSTN